MENKMIDFIQALDVPFKDMTAKELRREKAVHKWQANKIERGIYGLTKSLIYLQKNMQLIDMDEVSAQYKRGEISHSQFRSKCGMHGRRLQQYRRLEDCIEYANRLATNERAIIKYIEERLEDIKTRPNQKRNQRRGKIDPRKPNSWYNPKSDWNRTEPHIRPPKRLRRHSEKWDTISKQNKNANRMMQMSQAIDQWDYNKLKMIAQDRGYYTDMAVYAAVSDEMDMSINGAKKLLETGRMSWGQILLIGALFEMTPIEFCDVFLSGYFKEIVDGKWVATIEDEAKAALLARIVETRPSYDNFHPKEPKSVGYEDEESED